LEKTLKDFAAVNNSGIIVNSGVPQKKAIGLTNGFRI
jgi:hypothetical protein